MSSVLSVISVVLPSSNGAAGTWNEQHNNRHRDSHRPPPRRSRGRRLLAAHSVLVYVFLYAPIAVLAVLSFNAGMQVSLWRGFSFRWYKALVTDPEVRDGAVNSLLIAGIATVAATVVGTMAAIALARWTRRTRAPDRP